MAQTIIVDISTRGANPVAYTHQGDTGRTFFAEIYENGEAFAVAGYTIKVGAILPADRGYYVIAGNDMVTATKTTDGTNKIYFTLSDKYSLKAGNGILTLIFTSNTGTPSTIRPINIDLRIQKSADADDTIAGASDFPEGLESIAESVFQEYLSTYLPPVAPSSSAAANKAADAKLTGEALDDLKSDLNDMIVVTVGPNLTNPNTAYAGDLDSSTGQIYPGGNYYELSQFSVTPGEVLYIYWKVSDTDIRVRKTSRDTLAFYQHDGTFISASTNEDSYTVPPLAAYCVERSAQHNLTNGTVAVFNKSLSEMGGRWVPYSETKKINDDYVPVAITIDLENLNENAMLESDYLDFSMVNRLDPSACSIGKGVDINKGELYDNSSYFTTDFMQINENETLYFYSKDGGNSSASVNRYAAYDKDKNVLPSLGHVGGVNSVSQTGNMAYIRVAFNYYATDYYRTPNGKVCIASQNPPFFSGYGASPAIKSEYLRPVIWVYATDSASQVINKMINAYNISNCDVYFERATYSLGTEIEKLNTDYGVRYNEIPIGNNCRYYFNGATLTGNVDLSQHPTGEGEEEFYCNLLGCQRLPSSYELHDGVLIATDTRYVVHDESSALKGSYYHLYQNMEMQYITNARTEDIRKCIGGGTGASGVVEIVGCKVTSDATDSCVSYHGNSTDVVGAKFDLSIRNSWFSNTIRAGALSANQTARLFYTGNSAIGAPVSYNGWTVTEFLNEIRT